MGKIKGFLFAVRHREILMTDLGLKEMWADANHQGTCNQGWTPYGIQP